MKRKGEEQTSESTERSAGAVGQAQDGAAATTREPGDEPSYPPTPNPVQITHNNQASVRLLEYRGTGDDDSYYRIIDFPDGKPSDKVRQLMKDQGVRWNHPKGTKSWNVIIKYPTRHRDRLRAERVFSEVVGMILEEKGLVREAEPERF